MSIALFKAITLSKEWLNKEDIFAKAKELQETDPLAWWITVGNFGKVHKHFKGMKMDETVKDGVGIAGSVWAHIKEQHTYPYEGLKDLSLNEVFENSVADRASPKDVRQWVEDNPDDKNKENILSKLNIYQDGKAKYKAGVNAYDMTNYCTIPSTRTTGLGVAMHMHTEKDIETMMTGTKENEAVQPQVMLSHAWTEDMDEVMGILNDCVNKGVLLANGSPFTSATRVWFCCFAIYQPFKFNNPPRINQDELELEKGNVMVKTQMDLHGFEKVSAKAKDMIVIHTTKGDAYARLWCIVELWGAIKERKTIHMIGSKEYFLKYMSKVEGKYVLKGHQPAQEKKRRNAISAASGNEAAAVNKANVQPEVPSDVEPLNFYDFLVDFRKSEAGGNKADIEATLEKEIEKINKEFEEKGGQKYFLDTYMPAVSIPGPDDDVYNIWEGVGKEDEVVEKGENIYERHIREGVGKKDEVVEKGENMYERFDIEFLITLKKTFSQLKGEGGDVKNDGITFVENVVAFMRMKWLQKVAASFDGKRFSRPHWKINSNGTLVEVEGSVVAGNVDAKAASIDISGYRSSSGGNTRSSSFRGLANSLAQATDNMIAHSQQLEDEFVAQQAIIGSQEQRIQNQNARITAMERQATRAGPTRRVNANTRTTARNRNADEEVYYC